MDSSALVVLTLLCAACASALEPEITLSFVPPQGSTANLTGQTANVDPVSHRVAVFTFVQGWTTKPTFDWPLTLIQPDGNWECDITTGGADAVATRIAAFLLPASYTPPRVDSAAVLPPELSQNALAEVFAERHSPNAFHFSGYDWDVKTSGGYPFGPGPNIFSDSSGNVWVDGEGKLHLRITHRDGQWQCAEVILLASLGHGSYRFVVDSPVDALDPNVVLGLFTWSDDPAFSHREIDVEMSRWGNASDPTNAQYVVQPHETPGNLIRWTIPAGVHPTTHRFSWAADRVDFVSHQGDYAPLGPSGPEITVWAYTSPGGVPVPGDERVHLNLWLFQGEAPLDGQEVEVVLSRFVFVPAPLQAPRIDAFLRDQDGSCMIGASGIPQLVYQLESSTNLRDWTFIAQTTAAEAGFQFSDSSAALERLKFYRVRLPEQ